MSTEGTQRKLAAILSADVKEYSRLMSQDERGTIRTLTAYKEVMSTLIQEYKGRVVDAPGDNLLAEFGSVIDAVNCAVEIQRELAERNAELPPARQMEFRIGINLGDVVEEEGRIYGDGVNIAARVESLAEGGGICISGTVHDHVKNRIGLEYEFLGEQTVKNIPEPVPVYRVLSFPGAAAHRVVEAKEKEGRKWLKAAMAVALVLIVAAAAVAAWNFFLRPVPPSVEPTSVERMAFPLPDKPSIAVLPFVNMSGDPEQEYFVDGMTEDLITDLSQISGLFVVARNSTFFYKGKPVKVRQVAEELGVRYVLEGSVRKADKQVRINAQLIDATTGHHLWAKRYDGHLSSVFALQDKVTQKIVTALAVKLTASEQEQATRKETDNIEAYDAFVKGWEHYLRTIEEDFAKAASYFERAIELDPDYGRAYAALALTYWNLGWRYTGIRSRGISREVVFLWAWQNLQMAMRKPTSIAYQAASEIDLRLRKWREAIAKAKEAIDLDPNNAGGHLVMGRALVFCGRPTEAVEYIKKAMRLDPHYPARPLALLGLAHFCMGQYEEAATLLERSSKYNPELFRGGSQYLIGSLLAPTLAAAYAYLGRNKDAQAILSRGLKSHGWETISLRDTMRYYPFMYSKDAARVAEGLIKANMRKPHVYYHLFNENRLTGKEIKALVFGREVAGTAGIIDRRKDGEATFPRVGFYASDSGKSRIEGDMLCDQWKKRFGGLEICYPIFRNPDGSRTMLDEYLHISHDLFIRSFSPID